MDFSGQLGAAAASMAAQLPGIMAKLDANEAAALQSFHDIATQTAAAGVALVDQIAAREGALVDKLAGAVAAERVALCSYLDERLGNTVLWKVPETAKEQTNA